MEEVRSFFQHLASSPGSVLNPADLIKFGGLTIICLILFAEIGIFFCFFFPGDSLVFAAGVLCATGDLPYNWLTVVTAMSLSAISGNLVAFWFGRRAGLSLMKRKDTWYFRKQYLTMADEFYRKNEGLTLIIGNFLPIIRTFTPIFAGIINLSFPRFFIFSSLGVILWVVPLVTIGYFLGNIPFVQHNLGFVILLMVIAITTPIVLRVIKESKKNKANQAE